MESIEVRVQATKSLADIRFIRLKEGAGIQFGSYTPPEELPLPVQERDLDRSVEEGSLSVDDFLHGIARVLATLPEHPDCAAYREFYLAARPGHDRALSLEGFALEELKKPAEALERFRLVVGLRPGSAEAHFHAGRCHKALAEAEWPSLVDEGRAQHTYLAEHHFLRAIELDGNFAPAHYEVAFYLRRHGKLKQALAMWRKFVEIAPSDPRAERAKEEAEKVVEAEYLKGLYHVGKDAISEKVNSEALRSLKEVVSRVPEWGSAWHYLGAALRRGKKHAEGKEAAEKAVRLVPSDAEAVNGLGECLLHEKDWDGAERCFRRALDLRENDPGFMCNVGRVFLGRGDKDRAAFHIRMAAKLAPEDPAVKDALKLIPKA